MKPPRPKVHLVDVDTPLVDFSNLIMRCGAIIHFGEMVYARAVGETLSGPNDTRINLCSACDFLQPVGTAKRTYEYGLREREQAEETAEWEAVS